MVFDKCQKQKQKQKHWVLVPVYLGIKPRWFQRNDDGAEVNEAPDCPIQGKLPPKHKATTKVEQTNFYQSNISVLKLTGWPLGSGPSPMPLHPRQNKAKSLLLLIKSWNFQILIIEDIL